MIGGPRRPPHHAESLEANSHHRTFRIRGQLLSLEVLLVLMNHLMGRCLESEVHDHWYKEFSALDDVIHDFVEAWSRTVRQTIHRNAHRGFSDISCPEAYYGLPFVFTYLTRDRRNQRVWPPTVGYIRKRESCILPSMRHASFNGRSKLASPYHIHEVRQAFLLRLHPRQTTVGFSLLIMTDDDEYQPSQDWGYSRSDQPLSMHLGPIFMLIRAVTAGLYHASQCFTLILDEIDQEVGIRVRRQTLCAVCLRNR